MPRPRSLTLSVIAAAALTIIEREGLALLSMRTVAAELGVGTMSLYRYVDSRHALEGLVVDAVVAAVNLDLPKRMRWQARISTLVKRVRAAMRAHPAVVPLLLTRRHSSEGAVRWGEAMMGALAEGGFEGRARAIAFRTLLSYLIGAVQVEHFGPLSGEGTAALAALPRDAYPFLSETARSAERIAEGVEFDAGLAAVLRGLQRRA